MDLKGEWGAWPHSSWPAAPPWGLHVRRLGLRSLLAAPAAAPRAQLRGGVPPFPASAIGRPDEPGGKAALPARRMVDEIVWVKMTVNRRMAKSHGYYLQHAKVRAPRPARCGCGCAP